MSHPDKIVLKNKSVEKIVEDFYSEDYIVNFSKENAVIVNVVKGAVYLSYSLEENNSGLHHLMGVEITLTVDVEKDGEVKEREIKMDQTLGKRGEDYDWTLSSDFNFVISSLNDQMKQIIETQLYVLVKK